MPAPDRTAAAVLSQVNVTSTGVPGMRTSTFAPDPRIPEKMACIHIHKAATTCHPVYHFPDVGSDGNIKHAWVCMLVGEWHVCKSL